MASSSCPDAVDKPRLVANEPVARPGNNGLGDSVGRRPFVASRVVYAEHGSFGPVPTPIDVRHILAGLRVPPLQGRLDKSDDRDVRVDHLDLADPPSRDVADRHGIGSLQWLQRPAPSDEPISIDDQLHIRSEIAHARDLLGDGKAAARHSRERPKKVCRGVVAVCRFVAAAGATKPLLARSRWLVLGW